MVKMETIKKRLEKEGIRLSDQEIRERQEQELIKIKEVKCPLCQGNFSSEDIQTKKYAVEFSCPPSSATRYYHPDCLKLEKEKKTNPFLFAKVERLEKELAEIKKRV